jgi:hypothetical protein
MVVETAPGVFSHRTNSPARGVCDRCGADMRREPEKPCKRPERAG